MFFTLSKVFWIIANPGNLLLILFVVGLISLSSKSWRLGRRLIASAVIISVVISIFPLGNHLIYKLENRFLPIDSLSENIDGIIVLGGFFNQFVTKARGRVALNGAVERLIAMAALAKQYPKAKLVLSGGSGNFFRQNIKEVETLGPVLTVLGLNNSRIILESRSRNTFENALFTQQLLKPKVSQRWLLVTSAFHMPRAVGSFRSIGWTVIPYPVDYNIDGTDDLALGFNFLSGLGALNKGMHEWIGLFVYRLLGRTDSVFPGPKL